MQMISKTSLGQIFRDATMSTIKQKNKILLQTLLNDNTLNIPLMRRQVNEINMRWILRNLSVLNGEHVNFSKIIKTIRQINRRTI